MLIVAQCAATALRYTDSQVPRDTLRVACLHARGRASYADLVQAADAAAWAAAATGDARTADAAAAWAAAATGDADAAARARMCYLIRRRVPASRLPEVLA